MSSAFSRALPQAKLTSHDPRIVQVVTAPKAYLKRGDIGAKSNIDAMMNDARLGRSGNVRYVQVKSLDNPNGIGLEWKEREHQVLLRSQWRELNVPTYSEHETRPSRRHGSEAFSASDGSYQERFSQNSKTFKLPIVSRFDRSARKSAVAARPAQDNTTSTSTSNPAVVPHYSLMSEKEFQQLLDIVRENRATFLEQEARRFAETRRYEKYRRALQEYRNQEDTRREEALRGVTPPQSDDAATSTVEPILEDFPLEPELETARAALVDSSATSPSPSSSPETEIAALVNPFDLFNLARTTSNIDMAAFLKTIFARRKIDNPSSVDMPHSSSESGSMPVNPSTRLHPIGGLQFSQPDPIFADHLASAVPAHVIGLADGPTSKASRTSMLRRSLLASVGSRLMRLERQHSYGASEIDWQRENKEAGNILVKVRDAAEVKTLNSPLQSVPAVQRFSPSHAKWDSQLENLNLGYISANLRNETHTVANQNRDIEQRPFKNVLGSRDWHVDANLDLDSHGRPGEASPQLIPSHARSTITSSSSSQQQQRRGGLFEGMDGVFEGQEGDVQHQPQSSRLQMNRRRPAYGQRTPTGYGYGGIAEE